MIKGTVLRGNVEWQFKLAFSDTSSDSPKYFRTFDIVVSNPSAVGHTASLDGVIRFCDEERAQSIDISLASPIGSFLHDTIGQSQACTAMKLILPLRSGFCLRADFLERRMEGCKDVALVKGFLAPLQKVSSFEGGASGDIRFPQVKSNIANAIGGIVAHSVAALDEVEGHLHNRIDFPWLSSSQAPRKRVAWVAGRADLSLGKRIFEAAWALGITLVVIDKPGHWMQQEDPRWSHLREAFIPLDISADSGFVDRLVSAVRTYDKPIHGIATARDRLMVGIAKACEALGLPTSPSSAYEIAGDKYRTRALESADNEAFCVSSLIQLGKLLTSNNRPPLNYPLIVKPCDGWSSECVAKVHNQSELEKAVERALITQRGEQRDSATIMVEPYVDGPEVDANLVLLDGKIEFFEVVDDFPKSGDREGKDWKANFQETSQLLPTALPANEVEIIRQSLHKTALKQGFRNAVLHCEGRMRNSSMAYKFVHGVEDLQVVERGNFQQPSFFLHEVNARPPGYSLSITTAMTYGVDYYAIQLLLAVDALDRARLFAKPFRDGPQWWLVQLAIGAENEGIMKSEDPARDLVERLEELNGVVPDYKCFFTKGSRLSGPDATELRFLALISVIDRRSREQAIRLANKARSEFKYEVES